MRQFSTFNYQFSTSQRGFTLIELLIVISILSILSIMGITSYVNFSRSQAINNAAQDVALLLQQGRSYTASQVKQKQGTCTANGPFKGYRIHITFPDTYQLQELCNTVSNVGKPHVLPENIIFAGDDLQQDITFQPLTGGVMGPATLRITGYGLTKIVTIDQSGRIGIQ
jgi:prepilin-type N-terminal cleavage/methylation domain-containing protein